MIQLLQKKARLIVAMLLMAATLLVYAPIRDHQFLHYDDDVYVTDDVRIRQGVTWYNLLWALTATEEGLWKPVTLYSHMLDVQLFGLNPAGHLLVNLLIHVGNAMLLFWVLHQATGALLPSALVAALFALHPLSVESVAWVAERKNVLSTLFWLLTMGAYVGYVRQPSRLRYLGVLGSLVLGLMTKAMVVTLPCVLLLMDYWPLERLPAKWEEFRKRLPSLVVEKLPFFVPVAAVSAVTIYGAETVQGLQSLEELPLSARVGNALLGYGLYLKKMVWPVDLAVIYPLPRNALSVWPVVLAAMVLVVITVGVWRRRKESPYLVVGWSWFLGTLVPVNGLLQSGFQAMADRYAYVPMIGIFIMLSWGAVECLGDRGRGRKWLVGAGGCVFVTLAILTRIQLSYWQDTTTLFEHAVQATADNYLAYNILGTELTLEKKFEDAIAHYQEALKINPEFSLAYHNFGVALVGEGRVDEAIEHYQEALRINPDYTQAHHDLGVVLAGEGRVDEAIKHYQEALRINPEFSQAHHDLGAALVGEGRVDEAVERYQEVLKIDPHHVQVHHSLGVALVAQGRVDEAIEHYQEALKIDPQDAQVYYNLGVALVGEGRLDEAIEHYLEALKIDPEFALSYHNLGVVLVEQGRVDEAIEYFEKALKISPQDAQTHYNLGVALVEQGSLEMAIEHFSRSLEIDPQQVDARRNLVFVLDQTIEGYRRALQSTPHNAEMHNNLGVLLLRKGEVDEAIRHFSEAVRIDPNDGIAQENLDRAQSSR
jgi:tetratricopeptide (TPR) repeat protein